MVSTQVHHEPPEVAKESAVNTEEILTLAEED